MAAVIGGSRDAQARSATGEAHSSTAASWRSKLRLPVGRYRFEASARVENAAPLPFGKNQGAGLRILGRASQSARLVGTTDWKKLGVDFEVLEPSKNVELVCEFRSSAGQVWFDKSMLRLTDTDRFANESEGLKQAGRAASASEPGDAGVVRARFAGDVATVVDLGSR